MGEASEIALVNKNDICLIPKVDRPQYVTQFCLKSLCNTNYKIISMVIMERLKNYIPIWISPFQIGFMLRRNVQDNILVEREMVHNMDKMNGKKGVFVIKVGQSKSYDKLSWEFIWRTLNELKIPDNMINVIMHEITSVETNVKWNGA